MPIGIEPLLEHITPWLLVLFRITGIFLSAPLFGSVLVLARFKILLAVALSFCVYPMLLTPGSGPSNDLLSILGSGVPFWSLSGLVAAELGIGLVIGYGATLPLVGVRWGGRMIAQQIGLGIAEVFTPLPGGDEQSGSVSELFYLSALLIFVTMGGLQVLLLTLIKSFSAVPLGAFRVGPQVLEMVVGLLLAMLHLALRVAAPLLCLVFLETVATGFIARTVPQMNILSIGFAIRILLGTVLLIAAINTKFSLVADSIRQALSVVYRFFS